MLNERAESRNGTEIMIPAAEQGKADALVDVMRRQAEVMGQEEQREMLAFMRGVTFGHALGAGARGV